MKKHIIFLVLVVLISLMAGCSSQPPPTPITMGKYNMLFPGASYSHACSVIGIDGVETSSSEMPGIPGFTQSIRTVMYVWQNPDGSSMSAMFQNDKLISKAQLGLK